MHNVNIVLILRSALFMPQAVLVLQLIAGKKPVFAQTSMIAYIESKKN